MIAYKLDSTDYELISDIANNAYFTKRFQIGGSNVQQKNCQQRKQVSH